jgi:hypothetical protein
LALPLLTTTARILPALFLSAARDRWTGAAATRLRVKTAAAEQGRSATIIPRSGPPFDLIPAETPANSNPLTPITPRA